MYTQLNLEEEKLKLDEIYKKKILEHEQNLEKEL